MKTNDFSSASNAKRAAVGAKIPSANIEITKLPNGRFAFADTRKIEAVPYAFNEGTNSAGAPTGADEAPVETPAKRRGQRTPKAPTARDTAAPRKTRDGTKQAQLVAMLRRNDGATIAQIVDATGWQPHTVRGAFAGALKKKLGLTVTSTKEGGVRTYRV